MRVKRVVRLLIVLSQKYFNVFSIWRGEMKKHIFLAMSFFMASCGGGGESTNQLPSDTTENMSNTAPDYLNLGGQGLAPTYEEKTLALPTNPIN